MGKAAEHLNYVKDLPFSCKQYGTLRNDPQLNKPLNSTSTPHIRVQMFN